MIIAYLDLFHLKKTGKLFKKYFEKNGYENFFDIIIVLLKIGFATIR